MFKPIIGIVNGLFGVLGDFGLKYSLVKKFWFIEIMHGTRIASFMEYKAKLSILHKDTFYTESADFWQVIYFHFLMNLTNTG